MICKEIQSSSNLNRVDFSSCLLTHEGASVLANLIKVQALKRHNEAWKDSLRYGRPDLDSMFGIRRITINSNSGIGDRGVQYLADAFKSDLWLKALDMQDCGVTTVGANYLLDGLKFNAMMHVLDVRRNPHIDRDTLQKAINRSRFCSYFTRTFDIQLCLAEIADHGTSDDQQQRQQHGLRMDDAQSVGEHIVVAAARRRAHVRHSTSPTASTTAALSTSTATAAAEAETTEWPNEQQLQQESAREHFDREAQANETLQVDRLCGLRQVVAELEE